MGSADDDPQAKNREKPAHEVTLSEYWIGQTEVTNARYQRFRPEHKGKGDHPAVNLSWIDAQAFCASLGFQLPTEAQWEYAARAGTETAWSFGDDESVLEEYAWFGEEYGNGDTHPVGQKKANPWGLYDMHGNVWEWVADWYGPYTAEAKTNPTGPPDGTGHVFRGGSFANWSWLLRSAARGRNNPLQTSLLRLAPRGRSGAWGRNIGFRCVRVPGRQP